MRTRIIGTNEGRKLSVFLPKTKNNLTYLNFSMVHLWLKQGKTWCLGMCAGVTIELIVKSKLGSLKSLRLTGYLQWLSGYDGQRFLRISINDINASTRGAISNIQQLNLLDFLCGWSSPVIGNSGQGEPAFRIT